MIWNLDIFKALLDYGDDFRLSALLVIIENKAPLGILNEALRLQPDRLLQSVRWHCETVCLLLSLLASLLWICVVKVQDQGNRSVTKQDEDRHCFNINSELFLKRWLSISDVFVRFIGCSQQKAGREWVKNDRYWLDLLPKFSLELVRKGLDSDTGHHNQANTDDKIESDTEPGEAYVQGQKCIVFVQCFKLSAVFIVNYCRPNDVLNGWNQNDACDYCEASVDDHLVPSKFCPVLFLHFRNFYRIDEHH